MTAFAIAPGGTLGILGGGQLGRMIAIAAANLGYRSHILAPEADPPAGQVADRVTTADYLDLAALDRFAATVDAVTYEFENVPVAAVEHLAARVPVRPGAKALAVAQDRLSEKTFANSIGAGTAPFQAVDSAEDLDQAVASLGLPLVLKTRRFGYDGKGQAVIRTPADIAGAWAAMKGAPAIAEGFIDFIAEVSVVAARAADGTIAAFDLVENRHRHHILDVTLAPAGADLAPPALAAEGARIVGALLSGLDYVGVLAVEFFITRDGRLLVNEMAPRVHNSGHWTIEGAETSQFEQAARAALGLPLGLAATRQPTVMVNLIGADADAWAALLAVPGAHLHLYGKGDHRPGRKMGHVTRLVPAGATPESVVAELHSKLGRSD